MHSGGRQTAITATTRNVAATLARRLRIEGGIRGTACLLRIDNTAGAPRGLADQLYYIFTNLRRYIRGVGTYGAVVEQSNGAGQGCSMSILAANLYVATLLNYLRAEFPAVDVAAFLDDRNIVTHEVQDLLDAIAATKRFDDAAGHCTNVDKTAVFATAASDREALRRCKVGNDQLNVKLDDVMVGHCITTRRARKTTFLNGRAEKAALRAQRAAAVGATKRQRTRLIQQAVVPMAVSGTLWEIPSVKQLDGLRTSTINAIWGKNRKQRSREVVLAVLNDATKTDPLAAMVFRRLEDARRLMKKDWNRYLYARHVFELTKDEIRSGRVFQKGGSGTMKGLHQAAALLGGNLELNDDGFIISFAGAQPPLLLNEGSDSTWKARLRQTITNAITRQLAARTVDPEAMGDQDRRGKRKDLYGVGPAIDIYATTVNLRGRSAAVIERLKDIWDAVGADPDYTRYTIEEVDNQRLQAIIAGSVRAPDRLHKAGLVRTPSCPFCGCEKADLRHMMWTCSAWDTVRQPFLELIDKYRARVAGERGGPQRVAELERLIGLPCVANCGVIPESEYFKRGGAPIPPMAPRFLTRNSNLGDLTPSQLDRLRRDEQGRIVVFTDGSAVYPQDRRRRRAAWGTCYAPDHPWNADGPVHTDTQTVFAAELMATVHAMAAASTPTRIVSDCRAVVDIVRAELEADPQPIRGDYTDLRMRLRQ